MERGWQLPSSFHFILPVFPRTEYRSTNAYNGRAMANGNLPVVGHSDGKLTEILQVREQAVQTLLEFPDTHEICFHTSLVVSIGCHSHKAAEPNVRVRIDSICIGNALQDSCYLIFRESALGLLCSKMEFQQDAGHPAI